MWHARTVTSPQYRLQAGHFGFLQGVPVIAILAVPLPVITVCMWRAADVLFGPPQEAMSLEAAAALDARDRVRTLSETLFDPLAAQAQDGREAAAGLPCACKLYASV